MFAERRCSRSRLAPPDFGLQDVGCIRLSHVGQAVGGLSGIAGESGETAAHLDRALSAQRAIEHLGDIVVHAHELGFGSDGIGLLLLLVDITAKAEFAAQHDVLGDKAALFSAAVGAATNLVALVADGGVGVERGLFGFRFRAVDHGRGLLQRGIVVVGHDDKGFQFERRTAGDCLQQLGRRDRQLWRRRMIHVHAGHRSLLTTLREKRQGDEPQQERVFLHGVLQERLGNALK